MFSIKNLRFSKENFETSWKINLKLNHRKWLNSGTISSLKHVFFSLHL